MKAVRFYVYSDDSRHCVSVHRRRNHDDSQKYSMTLAVSRPPRVSVPCCETSDAAPPCSRGRRLHELDLALGAAARGRVLGEAGARLSVGCAAREEVSQ